MLDNLINDEKTWNYCNECDFLEGFWEDHKPNMWENVLVEMETKKKIIFKIRKKQWKYPGHIIKCNEWIKQSIH